MRSDNMTSTVDAGSTAPSRCPACRSQDVKTTSKVVNAEAYWRCCGCGEVWNVGRHRGGSRYSNNLPYQR